MIVQKLNKYIKENGLKKSYVAKKVGVSNVFLSQVINGHTSPSRELEDKIRAFVE